MLEKIYSFAVWHRTHCLLLQAEWTVISASKLPSFFTLDVQSVVYGGLVS